MKKNNYIVALFVFTALMMASCKKEDIRPVAVDEAGYEFVSKNDDEDDAFRSSKDKDVDSNIDDGADSDGKVVANGNSIIIIDNITDPNNDEDDKGKMSLKK